MTQLQHYNPNLRDLSLDFWESFTLQLVHGIFILVLVVEETHEGTLEVV